MQKQNFELLISGVQLFLEKDSDPVDVTVRGFFNEFIIETSGIRIILGCHIVNLPGIIKSILF